MLSHWQDMVKVAILLSLAGPPDPAAGGFVAVVAALVEENEATTGSMTSGY